MTQVMGYKVHKDVLAALEDVAAQGVEYELLPKKSHLIVRGPNNISCIVGGRGVGGTTKPFLVRNTVATVYRMLKEER